MMSENKKPEQKKMVKKKRSSKRPAKAKHEIEKEEYIQLLIGLFQQSGFEVRRERLKRGQTP